MNVTKALLGAAMLGFFVSPLLAQSAASQPSGRIIGMYVHQHWPYNHPYSARTWTLEDWSGYADGLKRLGYNTFLIWPMLETMPDPLLPSDQANIEKMAAVIDMLHAKRMRAYVVLCPNVGADNAEAAKAPFEKRHFFYCDTRVNPGDAAAMQQLLAWREKLLKPLARMDGLTIIDSDPGGYPGSTNAEFVSLLLSHRKLLDGLRPGIELYYWMHVGWQGYCRFYETGKFSWGTPDEQLDVLSKLKAANPEPWGLANGLQHAEKLGLADRVLSYNYGRIEGEPSFPLTNFGGDSAYTGGQGATARGVMGNAQTHCVQLPNTFAFARGATGQSLKDADYVRFADDLLVGQGALILEAWQALAGNDADRMQRAAEKLAALDNASLQPGPLKGLLFGNPRRFVNDLVMQLRAKATLQRFVAAVNADPATAKPAFVAFVDAISTWQAQHGYENAWWWPEMDAALAKMNSPAINAVLGKQFTIEGGPDPASKLSPFEQVHESLRTTETYTTRLLAAMKQAAEENR